MYKNKGRYIPVPCFNLELYMIFSNLVQRQDLRHVCFTYLVTQWKMSGKAIIYKFFVYFPPRIGLDIKDWQLPVEEVNAWV